MSYYGETPINIKVNFDTVEGKKQLNDLAHAADAEFRKFNDLQKNLPSAPPNTVIKQLTDHISQLENAIFQLKGVSAPVGSVVSAEFQTKTGIVPDASAARNAIGSINTAVRNYYDAINPYLATSKKVLTDAGHLNLPTQFNNLSNLMGLTITNAAALPAKLIGKLNPILTSAMTNLQNDLGNISNIALRQFLGNVYAKDPVGTSKYFKQTEGHAMWLGDPWKGATGKAINEVGARCEVCGNIDSISYHHAGAKTPEERRELYNLGGRNDYTLREVKSFSKERTSKENYAALEGHEADPAYRKYFQAACPRCHELAASLSQWIELPAGQTKITSEKVEKLTQDIIAQVKRFNNLHKELDATEKKITAEAAKLGKGKTLSVDDPLSKEYVGKAEALKVQGAKINRMVLDRNEHVIGLLNTGVRKDITSANLSYVRDNLELLAGSTSSTEGGKSKKQFVYEGIGSLLTDNPLYL